MTISNYTSIHTVLEDYLDLAGPDSLSQSEHGGVKEETILKWAHDAVERIHSDQTLVHRISLLPVENYKSSLPSGFRYVVQAAYRRDCTDTFTRDKLVQWKQRVEDDCELTIDITCPKCHETSCDCESPYVEVDVNRIYQDAHPELYTRYMSHFYGYGSLTDRGRKSPYSEHFTLMRKTSNNFFNVPYHIGNCLNINADCQVEYDINPPHIIVNFQKGEILLSYLSERTDEDGYRMIPDLPTVHEALTIAVDEKMAYRRWRITGEPSARVDWQNLHQLKEQKIARARSQVQIPDPDEWKQYMDNHWRKLIPYWDYDRNLGRFKVDEFNYGKYGATNSTSRGYHPRFPYKSRHDRFQR